LDNELDFRAGGKCLRHTIPFANARARNLSISWCQSRRTTILLRHARLFTRSGRTCMLLRFGLCTSHRRSIRICHLCRRRRPSKCPLASDLTRSSRRQFQIGQMPFAKPPKTVVYLYSSIRSNGPRHSNKKSSKRKRATVNNSTRNWTRAMQVSLRRTTSSATIVHNYITQLSYNVRIHSGLQNVTQFSVLRNTRLFLSIEPSWTLPSFHCCTASWLRAFKYFKKLHLAVRVVGMAAGLSYSNSTTKMYE